MNLPKIATGTDGDDAVDATGLAPNTIQLTTD
jgi:hypothetical protein